MEKLSELEELIRLIRILLGTVWGKAGRKKKKHTEIYNRIRLIRTSSQIIM